jgi:hypothetical protein
MQALFILFASAFRYPFSTFHYTMDSLFSTNWNDASEEDVSYTRLSVFAAIAVVLGLASFLIFLSPYFVFLNVLGIVFALTAVVFIARSERTLTGLRIAQTGLCCSIVSFVAVASLWTVYPIGVQREADQFFRIWFDAAAKNNVPLMKELNSNYWERPDTQDAEKWWKKQYEDRYAHKSIHDFTSDPLVRVLLALGDKAKVTYYKTLLNTTFGDKDYVENVYAVTYPAKDGKYETFFVKIKGERAFPSGDVKSAGWALSSKPSLTSGEE